MLQHLEVWYAKFRILLWKKTWEENICACVFIQLSLQTSRFSWIPWVWKSGMVLSINGSALAQTPTFAWTKIKVLVLEKQKMEYTNPQYLSPHTFWSVDQEWENHSWWSISSLTPVFVNRILLEFGERRKLFSVHLNAGCFSFFFPIGIENSMYQLNANNHKETYQTNIGTLVHLGILHYWVLG